MPFDPAPANPDWIGFEIVAVVLGGAVAIALSQFIGRWLDRSRRKRG